MVTTALTTAGTALAGQSLGRHWPYALANGAGMDATNSCQCQRPLPRSSLRPSCAGGTKDDDYLQ
jgi:hypothetical protein